VTFEQENVPPKEPPPSDSSSQTAPKDAPSVTDHDSWVKLWAAKNSAKKPRSVEKNVDTTRVADKQAVVDNPPADSNSPAHDNAKATTEATVEAGQPSVLRSGVGRISGAFTSDKMTAALGVVGELLITGGAVVLFYLAWQLWINNAIVAGEQAEAVKNFSNNITSTPSSSSLWTPKAGAIDYGPPPVLTPVAEDAVIGNLYVPRLGSGSTRSVANGVNNPGATINRGYYGKYEDSQWPGEPGNFAVAVHRTGWGTSFTQAQSIRPGDHMYLETPQGWYIYTVRNTEYVVPTQVDVVNAMPLSDAAPVDGQSILTITTCSPMNGNGERLVVYGFLSSWQPLEAGVPAEITQLVEEARA